MSRSTSQTGWPGSRSGDPAPTTTVLNKCSDVQLGDIYRERRRARGRDRLGDMLAAVQARQRDHAAIDHPAQRELGDRHALEVRRPDVLVELLARGVA